MWGQMKLVLVRPGVLQVMVLRGDAQAQRNGRLLLRLRVITFALCSVKPMPTCVELSPLSAGWFRIAGDDHFDRWWQVEALELLEDPLLIADEDQDALFQGDGLIGDSVKGVLGDRLAGLQVGGGGIEGAGVSYEGDRRPEDGAEVFVVLDWVGAEIGLGLGPGAAAAGAGRKARRAAGLARLGRLADCRRSRRFGLVPRRYATVHPRRTADGADAGWPVTSRRDPDRPGRCHV